MIQEYDVDAEAAGQRLDVFLAAATGLTRSRLQRELRAGTVLVNDASERVSYTVQDGDHITFEEAEVVITAVEPPEIPVVYEDEDIMVVEKPAGLTVHSGTGTAGTATMADFTRLHTTDPDPDRPGIVHRLDRETSGLMVVAKTEAAKAFMQQQFRDHAVRKAYLLLTVGRVEPETAIINLPLERDPAHPLRRTVVQGGRPSVTRYKTLASYPGYSFIEARPESGRTHQLRVHFAATGHPIAGDTMYGSPRRPLGLKRQFLHASGIEFVAPSGVTLSFESMLPADLQGVIDGLERV